MKYKVELHTGTDVFSNVRHSELGTALRMFERIKLGPNAVARRLWSSDTGRGNWRCIRSDAWEG